jgi:hypothetical protein
MSVPQQVNDGDYSVAQQDGPWRFSFPFQTSRNDGVSFEAHRTMIQDQASYTGPAGLMSIQATQKGDAYMVESSPTVYLVGGLLQWEETYASIPQTQTVNSSIVYTYQFCFTPANYSPSFDGVFPLPDPPELGDITKSMAATTTYTYGLTAFTPIDAPRVVVLFGRFIYYFGGWGTFASGQSVLAEDSVDEVYKAGIHMQKQIKIMIPSYTQPPAG